MKKLLVPVDYSNNSMKGLYWAIDLAEKISAEVILIHVEDMIADLSQKPYRTYNKYAVLLLKEEGTRFGYLKAKLMQEHPLCKLSGEIIHGLPAEAISEYAQQHDIDLIVMGSKGAGALKRALLGSVTIDVINKTKIPVIVISGQYQPVPVDTVILLIDKFDLDQTIIRPIMEIAKTFNSTVQVINFTDNSIAAISDYLHNNLQLKHFLKQLKPLYPGLNIKGRVVSAKEFEAAVREIIHQQKVGVITFLSQHKSWWERIFIGSVTLKMATALDIPVLCIPLSEEKQELI